MRYICHVVQVGDVLYLPRGTVHQAVAQAEDSSHLTLSSYQRWTLGAALGLKMKVGLSVLSLGGCKSCSLCVLLGTP